MLIFVVGKKFANHLSIDNRPPMSAYYRIAVDGFSSCGKSTLARQIAEVLGAVYIDSGAMYRAATLLAIQNNCIRDWHLDTGCFMPIIQRARIEFRTTDNHLLLNEKDVEKEIRSPEVADHVSEVASHGFIREIMVQMQRSYSEKSPVVMDGRDIGTHVFPDAEVKIFLTAEPRIRAERRYQELQEQSVNISFDEVFENVKKRDEKDQNRSVAPLRKADDAIEINNSYLSRSEQLEQALEIVHEKIGDVL